LGRVVCGIIPVLCGDLVGAIVSADKNLDNYDRYDVLAGHDPAGTSVKNLKHFK
jgi:gastric triacylglycerol lipase